MEGHTPPRQTMSQTSDSNPSSEASNPPAADLTPGSRIYWLPYLHHVVDIVNDEGERLLVTRCWFPIKESWEYRVIPEVVYEHMRNQEARRGQGEK